MTLKIKLLQGLSNLIYYLLIKTNIYKPRGIRVLCYHDIKANNTHVDDIFTVTIDNFRQQLQYLFDNHYTVISIPDFWEIITKNKDYPPKTVMLTFDDGFQSVYNVVSPFLKQYNYPATVFITSQFIDKNTQYLSRTQLEALAKNPLITIGSHGVSHLNLVNLSLDEARKEIANSKNILEEITNLSIEAFAYPYGFYNRITQRLLTENNFLLAFTTRFGFNYNKSNNFSLKRITIFKFDTISSFEKKLLGAYNWRGLWL
mgnify:CR=1 FL=1